MSITNTVAANSVPLVSLPNNPPVSSITAIPTFDDQLAGLASIPKEQVNALPITLFSDYVEIQTGKNSKKQISYQNLKDLIDRSLNIQEKAIEVKGVLLPSNVFFFSQSATTIYMNSYFSGGNRSMIYDHAPGDHKMNIVAPNIVISQTLKKDRDDWLVSNTFYFCTDLPLSKLPKTFITKANPAEGLYVLPMSNTYSEGNMCYGGNSMPVRYKDNNFRGLDWYFKFLWETPFNNDLGIKAIGDNMSVGAWYTTLEKLAKDNKPFPYEKLRGWKQIS